ncbi:MAG: dihydrolipoamide acetyltransferase family protein [Planctomycetota bacterium]|jgi:pyruvate dehydrogenase E2 component (dihydrolipoamide acetyltransferase)
MAEPILMPRLTIDMEKGTVLEWFKEEGDAVAKGDIVAMVFGDKVEWEVESPADGVLIKVLIQPDEEVGVARPIAYVGEAGEAVPEEGELPAPLSEAVEPKAPGSGEGDAPAAAAPEAAGSPERRPKASPAAKRIAREKGIDLKGIRGSGPKGRIVEADVLAAAGEAPAGKEGAEGALTLSPLRKTIAERMLKSWRTVPHFTVETAVEMKTASAFRKEAKGPGGNPFTYNDLIVASVARALKEMEPVRRRWDGNTLTALRETHLGVAVHTDQGLVVPVVENAGEKPLERLAVEIREKAERARSGKLKPEDLKPAAMTVTNLGMFGITRFVPVVNHPECSILAVGKVVEEVVYRDGWIGALPMMSLNLAVDHRAIDGGQAARFLERVKALLEQGEWS